MSSLGATKERSHDWTHLPGWNKAWPSNESLLTPAAMLSHVLSFASSLGWPMLLLGDPSNISPFCPTTVSPKCPSRQLASIYWWVHFLSFSPSPFHPPSHPAHHLLILYFCWMALGERSISFSQPVADQATTALVSVWTITQKSQLMECCVVLSGTNQPNTGNGLCGHLK